MALFKISKGTNDNRLLDPSDANFQRPVEGHCYYDTTNHIFYIDTETPAANATLTTNNIGAYRQDMRAKYAARAYADVNGNEISSTYTPQSRTIAGLSLANNITKNQLNLELDNAIVVCSDNVTVTTDSTKGTSPYNTSYGYTNIVINNLERENLHNNLTILLVCSGNLVASSAYRNVRIRLGSDDTDNWIPVYYTTSIAGGSSYFTNGTVRFLTYRTDVVSSGAFHIYTDNNTTYSPQSLGFGYATCSTAAATTAKVASLSSYTLTANGIVAVKFTYDVPANATLNINGKGPKAIYYQGAAIKNDVIKAGNIAYFIYSTYYHLLGVDNSYALSNHNHNSSYKSIQTAVSDPAASGNATSFIDSISQNAQGVITATKKSINNVTTSAAGLMSAADKTKLDAIAANANNYSLPTASASALGGVKVGTNLSISEGVLSATDTWKANTSTSEGYVASGNGQANKVWKTDAQGNPGWRNDTDTVYTHPSTHPASMVTGLATVATSGSYNDLSNKPTTLKNPNALSIGSKSYDGSSAVTITAADLGLSNAMHFLGITTTSMSDGLTTAAVVVSGKSITPNAGDVVLDDDTHMEYVWSGNYWELLGGDSSYALSNHNHNSSYKSIQTAVSDPAASGNATSFIDSISQNAQGVITATKKSINISGKLDKLTYEWNKSISFGSSGYLQIGKFPMYDTNITIDIDATTTTTYHATVVIATQNVSTTSIGTAHAVNVYGDETNTITNNIRVVWSSGSNIYTVYFVPSAWSKNLIHIRANGLSGIPDESEICKAITSGSAPTSTSGLSATNVLKANYKIKQTAVSDPSASGSATSFIDSISQNTQGVITVTKKNIDISNKINYSDLNKNSNVPDEETLTNITDYEEGIRYIIPQGTYSIPSGGIPLSDLSPSIQESLAKADRALQLDDAEEVESITLADVATSGDYNDLINIPDISGKENTSNKVISLSSSSTNIQYPSAKCVYDGLTTKANLNGGNTFNDNQQFNGLIYLEGSTPFFLSKQGKIGMRATNESNENLGQINISNAWYDSNHYGCQMNAKNKATGKFNALRVSHNGVQYFDENDTAHSVALTDSPALTGTPTAPTAAVGTNTTQIATTAFVKSAVTAASNDHMQIVDITGVYSPADEEVTLNFPTGTTNYFEYIDNLIEAGNFVRLKITVEQSESWIAYFYHVKTSTPQGEWFHCFAQREILDDNSIRGGLIKITETDVTYIEDATYFKPNNGIPTTDFTNTTQTLLSKTDNAIQTQGMGWTETTTVTVTWDGDTTNVLDSIPRLHLYKISNLTPSKEALIGSIIRTYGGSVHTVTSNMIAELTVYYAIMIDDMTYIVASNTIELDSGAYLTAGMWIQTTLDPDYISSIGPFTMPVIHSINSNYLPSQEHLQTKSITDSSNYFNSDTVEGALQELGAAQASIPYIDIADTAVINTGDNNTARASDLTCTLRYYPSFSAVYMRIYCKNAIAFTANTTYKLIDIPEQYKPLYVTALAVYDKTGGRAYMSSSTQNNYASICYQTPSNINTGYALYFSGIWLVNSTPPIVTLTGTYNPTAGNGTNIGLEDEAI